MRFALLDGQSLHVPRLNERLKAKHILVVWVHGHLKTAGQTIHTLVEMQILNGDRQMCKKSESWQTWYDKS